MQQGILKFSSNRGRYELCTTGSVPMEGEEYPELSSGMVVEIELGRQWIRGSVEHAPVYATERTSSGVIGGYYFIASNGGVCGLCEGVRMRIPNA